MDIQIIVDKDLGIAPAEIVAAWNSGPYGATPARLELDPAVAYDAGLLELIVLTVTTIGSTLVASGIQQIVNDIFTAKHPAQPGVEPPQPPPSAATGEPPVEVIQLTNQDGSPLLVVRRRSSITE
ncbi:hypothetical protein [Candidatus Chloroploca asiatica]|uniref:Uncharacterized protein n=1 Tax=Candidatus Chloroploca asiatica TaxID=1506545 RepID=A0A2H3KJ70_9CHLR|nr:hypothetical protein [Candidatus Chloroploca asiatica]PDV97940.1 hypothetical protein A9Q02_16810 [Candidatus Chloroploca asiatica]